MYIDAASPPKEIDSTLARVIEEAVAAAQAGQPLEVEPLAAAYPQFAAELRELLPAAGVLLQLRSAPSSSSSSRKSPSGSEVGGQPLGDFKLIREMGRGGMGVVYEAEQLSLGRRVALKVLPLAGMLDRQQLARFQNESKAVATLNHPHIVPIYAVGCDRGVHYYAMQLIEGRSLAQVLHDLRRQCTHAPLVTSPFAAGAPAETPPRSSTSASRQTREYFRTAARLFAEAAEAIDHAHDRAILHRDVKPANLLLDESGKLWVADFGLAQLGGQSQLTLTGDLVGTLRYMSPEQAFGKRGLIDGRADVYSLGATLYELLTLEPVYQDADREALLAAMALSDPRPVRQLNRQIPIDLETIVGKALQRDPADRYASAGELAADLRRFLAQQPIEARPPTVADRFTKYVRRHTAVATSIGAALLVVSAALIAATLFVNNARREALAALSETSELLYAADMATACHYWEKNWPDEVRAILDRHRPRASRPDYRGYEWDLLERQTRPPRSQALSVHRGAVHELALLPDGRTLASVGDDGALRLWDLEKQQPLPPVKLSSEPLYAVAASPDGRYLAAGGMDSTVYLCDRRRNYAVQELYRGDFSVESLAFSSDGRRLAAGYRYEEVCLLTLSGQLAGRTSTRARVKSLEFVPETSSWRFPQLIKSKEGARCIIEQWNSDLSILERKFPSTMHFACSAPDGRALIGVDEYRRHATVIDLASESTIAVAPGGRDRLWSLAVSPDGGRLALGYASGIIECFELEKDGNDQLIVGSRPQTFRACRRQVIALQFIDGLTLATGGADGLVSLWRMDAHEPFARRLEAVELRGMSLSPDGQSLLSWNSEGLQLIDADNGDIIAALPDGVNEGVWSPCGAKGAAWTEGAAAPIHIFDQGGRPVARLAAPSAVSDARFSPNGERLITIGEELRVIDLDTRQARLTVALTPDGAPLRSLELSHDGSLIAYGGRDETIVVMHLNEGQQRFELPCQSPLLGFAFNPDDSLLATANADSVIRVWSTKTGRLCHEFRGHAKEVHQVAFTPSGSRLFSAGTDGTTRLWSLPQDRQLGILYYPRHGASLAAEGGFSLSAGGRRLAIWGRDAYGRSELLVYDPDPALAK